MTAKELQDGLKEANPDDVVIFKDANGGWTNINFNPETVTIEPACNVIFSDDLPVTTTNKKDSE